MPDLGRWTQQDPLGGSLANFSSYNRYVYANNDPVNEVDTSGKFTCGGNQVMLVVGGILLALVTAVAVATVPEAALPFLAVALGAATGLYAFIQQADAVSQTCYNQNLF